MCLARFAGISLSGDGEELDGCFDASSLSISMAALFGEIS
jgi:hypothetical protein